MVGGALVRLPRSGVVRVGLAVAAGGAAVAVGVGLLLAAILQARDTADATLRSDAFLRQVIAVERSVVDAETGLRGYVITGAAVFLAPLHNAERVLPREVRAMTRAARADHQFVNQARALGAASLSYISGYVGSVLELPGDNRGQATSLSTTLRGKRLVDQIRVQTAVLEAAISGEEAHRQNTARSSAGDAVEEDVIVLALLVALTIIVGVVVGRLVLSRGHARERAEFLAAASRRLDESLSVEAVLGAGAELLAERLADACAIRESDADPPFVAERGDASLLAFATGEPAVAAALRARASAAAGLLSAVEPATFDDGVGGIAIAGAAHRRQVIDVVLLRRRGRWTAEELEDAVEISTRIALATQLRQLQARTLSLYERTSSTARTLQESLLPSAMPDIPLCDVAVRFSPAGEGDLVGGDFYDAFPVSAPREWAVIVGDVCGKGAQAAAMTAMARWTLRSHPDAQPADALRALNDAIRRQNLGSRFITVADMRVSVADDHALVVVACGGHPPPIHVRRDGGASAVDAGGDLIGIWADPRLHTAEVRLEPGDLLVAFTDGAADFSAEPLRRLEELLGDLRNADAAGAVSAVANHALERVSSSRDDVAVVAIGFVGRRRVRATRAGPLAAVSR
jgi:serine phosphatase RsbU (regulator of sigma subunit)/CHASE3 domain sensor protein